MSRWSEEPRFTVRQVTSASMHPDMPFAYSASRETRAFTATFPESHAGLAKLVESFTDVHGVRPSVSGRGVGPRDDSGRRMAFRWSWEKLTPWGRVTDTLFVTVDSWS